MAEPTGTGQTSTLTKPESHNRHQRSQSNTKSWKAWLPTRTRRPGKLGVPFLFFGVGLPLLAVLFELSTHYCARNFFDPFPSSNHIVLFLLIPLSNFLVWLSGRRDMSAHYGFMCLISGMSMGIGILYALMFLPITAQSAMYTLVFGLGLLGFAPILSIPCSWLGGKTACHLASTRKTFFDPHQVEHIGHLIVLCLVVAVELPSTLTRMNLGLASESATSAQGVNWLRQYGSEEVMLRACYERSGRATDILGSLYESAHPLTVDAARKIFFKVIGKPFNAVPIPASARGTIQHAGLVTDIAHVNDAVTDEFDLDADIAGETVSGVARGLSVDKTSLNAAVNADAAVAEYNFAFELKNVSAYDREARTLMKLAPGAVVTGAFVTVDGVEHEARILVRDAARQEYRQSVSEHRNPLLVSMVGPDQVLVQCFPVHANGSMLVRLKIAAPLVVSRGGDSCALQLPVLVERNFQLDAPINISLSGAAVLATPVEQRATTELFSSAGHTTTFDLASSELGKFRGAVLFKRDPAIHSVVAPDSFSGNANSIQHDVFAQEYPAPSALTVVIDGSASMAPYLPEIAKGLSALPQTITTNVLIVGDSVLNLGSNKRADIFAASLEALAKYKPAGGQIDGTEVVRSLENTPVLWIHGSQPFDESNKDQLSNLLSRQTSTPWLYDFTVAAGANELLSGLQPNANLANVARVGTVSDDLRRLISGWQAKPENPIAFQNWNPAAEGSTVMSGTKLVGQFPAIAQLYGYQQLIQSLNGNGKIPAVVFADRYHLVSPVSSAVVVDDAPQKIIPEPVGGSIKDHVERWYQKSVIDPIKESQNQLGTAHGAGALSTAKSDANVASEDKGGTQALDFIAKQKAASVQEEMKAEVFSPQLRHLPNLNLSRGGDSFQGGVVAPTRADAPESAKPSNGFSSESSSLQGATNGTIGPVSPSVPPEDAASDWIAKVGKAFTIFALVFLTMFAGIKLMSALKLPKHN